MMNMAKLGIVSAAGNYFHSLGNPRKQRAGGLMRYTLCVFQGKARQNGSRNGFTVSPMKFSPALLQFGVPHLPASAQSTT